MPALFPAAVTAEDYMINQPVRWFVSDRQVSPYVGIVRAIHPGIQKVDVMMPFGGLRQCSPEELIPISPYSDFMAALTPHDNSGFYTSYMIEQNQKFPLMKGVSGKIASVAYKFYDKILPVFKSAAKLYNLRVPKNKAFEKLANVFCEKIGEGTVASAINMIYDSHVLYNKTAQSPFDYGATIQIVLDAMREPQIDIRKKKIQDGFALVFNGTHSNIFTDIGSILEQAYVCSEEEEIEKLVKQAVIMGQGDTSSIEAYEKKKKQILEEEEKKAAEALTKAENPEFERFTQEGDDE